MQWRRNLWFLSAGTFISNIAFTMLNPFLPVFLKELGVQGNLSYWSGIMISVNFLPYALAAPIWGSLADRHGKRVMLVRSGFGIALTFVLQGIAFNRWDFLFYRALNGLLSGFIPSAIMLVATNTPQEEMGFSLGILNTFIALGGIMGPFFGGALLEFVNVRMLMFIAAGLLCVASALAVFGTTENIVPKESRKSMWHGLKTSMNNKPLLIYFFCMVMLQTATYIVQPTLPLRIAELCKDNTEFVTGIIFSIIGISLAIGSPLVSRIKNKSYLMILLYGLVSCGILNLVQGLTYSVLMLGLERFLFGFANAAVNVSGNVLITESVSEDIRGSVFGTLNGLTAVGAVLGPLIGGGMGEKLGNASSFYGGAVLFFLAAFAVWWHSNINLAKESA